MAKAASPPHHVNQQELADLFGVDRRTIRDWDNGEDGLRAVACVSKRPLLYDALAAWSWRWDTKRKEKVTLVDAKLRKLEAEAAQKELELAEARGRVVRVEVFDQVLGGALDRVRAKLMAFEGGLAPRLVGLKNPREAQAVLVPAFSELLDELRVTEESDAA